MIYLFSDETKSTVRIDCNNNDAVHIGMIEIVSEAETLRAIQTEWGLTGSFKDKPIAEWLAKHNPSELEYQRARDNFTGQSHCIHHKYKLY